MRPFPIHTILSAGGSYDEDTIWIQILVFVTLATSWWIYSLVKRRPENLKNNEQNLIEKTRTSQTKSRWHFRLPGKHIAGRKDAAQKYAIKAKTRRLHIAKPPEEIRVDLNSLDVSVQAEVKNKSTRERAQDLSSGMELLELDFLLSIVESTKGDDKNRVTMRKLTFNELLRREKQNQIASSALKVYAINQGNLYGKNIQCEAIRELAERTGHKRKL